MVQILKKDGRKEDFDKEKIKIAVGKSAERVNKKFSEEENNKICQIVFDEIEKNSLSEISIPEMHKFVELALDEVSPAVAKSYRDYRNYKNNFINIMDDVLKATKNIRYLGDKSNANTDSSLVATKRSLIYKKLNSELYQQFFLKPEEKQTIKDGYIYIHDLGDRLDSHNCCLFRLGHVLKDGFDLANVHYNEPKSIDVAFDVSGDIIFAAAAQQYGGFTLPEIEKILAPYAEKSFQKYLKEYKSLSEEFGKEYDEKKASDYSTKKVEKEIAQGVQGWEMKLNTIGSSRGDFPFTTVTFGLGTGKWEKMISKAFMSVRKNGQGKEGKKIPVLFPKLVFLYDENLHGKGKENYDIFEEAIDCSSKCMYPDYLSLTGDGYVADLYKKYKRVVSPMGCRAFLGAFFEKSDWITPADETDLPVFEGRFNGGAISLNIPMIFMKSKEEGRDFFEVLDENLQMARAIHRRTFKYLSRQKASINPLGFCEGGFYGGNLNPDDCVASLVRRATFSYAYTGLNEVQMLFNGKSLVEDGDFAFEVLNYLNNFTNKYKEEDGIAYALYGTPGESLLPLQVQQFRKKYGIIEGVSNREYFSNSFHCAVWEKITPIEKQDTEYRFFHTSNGGHISFVRLPNGENKEAIQTLIERSMKKGFYEGINIEKNYCEECGEQFSDNIAICPKCGSKEVTQINRVCGYLGFSKVNGDTRMNEGKLKEIEERVSM